MKKFIFTLFSILYALFSFVTPTHAQSVSLSISPPVTEILISPGKSVSQTFTLKTQGENIAITPELHLATPSDSAGHMTIDPIPVDPSTIPLIITMTGSSTSPTLTFTASNIDTTQDLYLALVFKIDSSDLPLHNQSSATPAISALILITITPSGILPINLEIQDFTLPLLHDSYLPLTLAPTLTNHADIMIAPEGTLEIISPSNQPTLTLSLYPNLILGNSSRQILSGPSSPLPLTWSPTWRNLGPYRVRLTITTQGGTKISQIEKVVWILPLRFLIILSLLILILILVYRTKLPKPQLD